MFGHYYRVLHFQMLTEDTARTIGISAYYPLVRKSFNDILKALDSQFGRPLMMTNTQNVNKVRKMWRFSVT